MRCQALVLSFAVGMFCLTDPAVARVTPSQAVENAKARFEKESKTLRDRTLGELGRLEKSATGDAVKAKAVEEQRKAFADDGVVPALVGQKLKDDWEHAATRLDATYAQAIAETKADARADAHIVEDLIDGRAKLKESLLRRGIFIWVPLFDGRTLDGWVEGGTRGDWLADRGTLTFRGRGGKKGGNTLVTSRGDFENFRLRVKLKDCVESTGWIGGRCDGNGANDGAGFHLYTGGSIHRADFPQFKGDLYVGGTKLAAGLDKAPRDSRPATLELEVRDDTVHVFVDGRCISTTPINGRVAVPREGHIALSGPRASDMRIESVTIMEYPPTPRHAAAAADAPPADDAPSTRPSTQPATQPATRPASEQAAG